MKRAILPVLALISLLVSFTSCKPKTESRFVVELSPLDPLANLSTLREEYIRVVKERFSHQEAFRLLEIKVGAGSREVEVRVTGAIEQEEITNILTGRGQVEFLETTTFLEASDVLMAWNDKMKTIPELYDSTSAFLENEEAKGSWLDSLGNEEPDLETQRREFLMEYPLFEFFSPPEKIEDPQSPLLGYALAEDRAKFEAVFNHPELRVITPERISFHWERKPVGQDPPVFGLIGVKQVAPERVISNENIIAAEMGPNGDMEDFVINLTFDEEGAHAWRILTRKNVGKSIAVLLDGRVITYPAIKQEIMGGRTMLSGNFTFEEALELLQYFKMPALPPVQAEVVQTTVIAG